jgi:hypothetical protein
MKDLKKQKLENLYKFVCLEYINKFSEKHDLIFDFWVEDIGIIAQFSGIFKITFVDIVHDINMNLDKKLFQEFLKKKNEFYDDFTFKKFLEIYKKQFVN